MSNLKKVTVAYKQDMIFINHDGNVKGEVIEHEEPSEWRGYKNMGSVLIR